MSPPLLEYIEIARKLSMERSREGAETDPIIVLLPKRMYERVAFEASRQTSDCIVWGDESVKIAGVVFERSTR